MRRLGILTSVALAAYALTDAARFSNIVAAAAFAVAVAFYLKGKYDGK